MSTTLITGATGFVGSACVRQLARTDRPCYACARSKPIDQPSGATFHSVDLLDEEAATALIAEVRPTHLLHLAWIATPSTYRDAAENDDWMAASKHLFRTFAANGGRRCVVAGTCAEYDWTLPGPYRERESATRPNSAYGRAKDELRVWTEREAAAREISTAWARLFFLYGPHEHGERFVSSVVRSLLAGQIADCTAGTQVRDFLQVEDAARALLALLQSDVDGPVNIASGEGVTVRTVAECIAAAVGPRGELRMGTRPTPTWEPDEIVGDVRRICDEVGWRPELTLARGLAETVDWWRTRERAV